MIVYLIGLLNMYLFMNGCGKKGPPEYTKPPLAEARPFMPHPAEA